MNDLYSRLMDHARSGERIDQAMALELFDEPSPERLYHLGEAADIVRKRRYGRQASFIHNLQVNPSNICVRTCSFCDYAALPRRTGGYILEEDEIFATIDKAMPSEVHIVGGLNHVWNYPRSLELVREVRRRYPDMHIKAFTAIEIHWFSVLEKKSFSDILSELREAGLDALPGGGAEMFSDRIRDLHFKSKIGRHEWLAVHEAAHKLGIPSNCTMLYGLGETWAERVSHLLQLRELQDRSGGFVSFIPLALQFGKNSDKAMSPLVNLTVIAMARLLLDNIPHIKAYWPMIGIETAGTALSYGADDLDGTLGLERIAHASGAKTPEQLAADQMVRIITEAGFEPVQRNGRFHELADLGEHFSVDAGLTRAVG